MHRVVRTTNMVNGDQTAYEAYRMMRLFLASSSLLFEIFCHTHDWSVPCFQTYEDDKCVVNASRDETTSVVDDPSHVRMRRIERRCAFSVVSFVCSPTPISLLESVCSDCRYRRCDGRLTRTTTCKQYTLSLESLCIGGSRRGTCMFSYLSSIWE